MGLKRVIWSGFLASDELGFSYSKCRRGLATGLAVTAFGGGALLATPVTLALYEHFFELPQFLGAVSDVQMVTQEGQMPPHTFAFLSRASPLLASFIDWNMTLVLLFSLLFIFI